MRTYQPVLDYLAQRDDASERLTFKRVERIIGRALPPSAYKHRAWWSNANSQSLGFLLEPSGWKIGAVDQRLQLVTFVHLPSRG